MNFLPLRDSTSVLPWKSKPRPNCSKYSTLSPIDRHLVALESLYPWLSLTFWSQSVAIDCVYYNALPTSRYTIHDARDEVARAKAHGTCCTEMRQWSGCFLYDRIEVQQAHRINFLNGKKNHWESFNFLFNLIMGCVLTNWTENHSCFLFLHLLFSLPPFLLSSLILFSLSFLLLPFHLRREFNIFIRF